MSTLLVALFNAYVKLYYYQTCATTRVLICYMSSTHFSSQSSFTCQYCTMLLLKYQIVVYCKSSIIMEYMGPSLVVDHDVLKYVTWNVSRNAICSPFKTERLTLLALYDVKSHGWHLSKFVF